MTDSISRQDAAARQEIAVDVGVLKVQMAHVNASLDAMRSVNKEQSQKLEEILEKLSEAKGGWRTLMWLGGAAATLSGTIGVWVGVLTGRH